MLSCAVGNLICRVAREELIATLMLRLAVVWTRLVIRWTCLWSVVLTFAILVICMWIVSIGVLMGIRSRAVDSTGSVLSGTSMDGGSRVQLVGPRLE